MYTILLVIHTILVLFLIVMVLIQRTDSDGLGGLGGGGGNQFMTGRSTANLMTRTTAILAGAFMLTSLTLAIMASHMTAQSIVDAVPPSPVETIKPGQTTPSADEKQKADYTAKDSKMNKKDESVAPVKSAPPVKKEAPSVPKPE